MQLPRPIYCKAVEFLENDCVSNKVMKMELGYRFQRLLVYDISQFNRPCYSLWVQSFYVFREKENCKLVLGYYSKKKN